MLVNIPYMEHMGLPRFKTWGYLEKTIYSLNWNWFFSDIRAVGDAVKMKNIQNYAFDCLRQA